MGRFASLRRGRGRSRRQRRQGRPGYRARWKDIRLRLADNSLAGRASRALGWNFTSNALGRLGTAGIGIVLARMLGPHAFGTYAVAWVALIAMGSFNDFSLSLAIVRWPGDPAEIAPTIMTIATISSVVIYAGCFVCAPAYASAMGAPAATGVVRVLAVSIVLDGLVATPVALLDRYFRQDRRTIADQVNNWLGAFVCVGLAWTGFGAMSLALGRITGALAAAVLYLAFSPEPVRFGFDRTKVRALIRYGAPLTGSTIIMFAVTNMDQLVVGRMLGPTTLGFYVLASNLAAWPVAMFSQPVRTVAPAAFSRLQHDQTTMRAGFLSAATLLGAVTLPVCLSIGGSAVALIGLVYGARWLPAAHVLMWLALLAALTIFFQLTYDYLVVLARTRVIFIIQLVWLITLIPALIAGADAYGMVGVGAAEVAVGALVILPLYLRELSRVGIRRRAVGGRLCLPLAGGAVAGLAAVAAGRIAPNYPSALAASCVTGLVIIALVAARLRGVLALLRPRGSQPGPPGTSTPAVPPAGPPALSRDVVAQGPGTAQIPPAIRPAARPPEGCQQPASPLAAPLDAVLPQPGYRDEARPPRRTDSAGRQVRACGLGSEAAPVYRQTVAALRWDPATADHSGYDGGPSQALPARCREDLTEPGQQG